MFSQAEQAALCNVSVGACGVQCVLLGAASKKSQISDHSPDMRYLFEVVEPVYAAEDGLWNTPVGWN